VLFRNLPASTGHLILIVSSMSSSFFQPVWDRLLQEWVYSERALFIAGTWLILEATFWGFNLFYYLCYRYGWLSQYKILPGKYPDRSLVLDCLRQLSFNHFIIRPISLYFLYDLFIRVGMKVDAPLPPLHVALGEMLAFILIADTGFYWSHRLLHHGAIYKYVHKQHHQFKVSIGLAAEYAHPIEQIISNQLPTIAGPLLLGSHMAVLWLWLWLRVIETVDAHSGFDFPFTARKLLPGIVDGSERHDFHHSHNVGNYGAFLTLWDRLMGTDKAYHEFIAKKAAGKTTDPPPEKED